MKAKTCHFIILLIFLCSLLFVTCFSPLDYNRNNGETTLTVILGGTDRSRASGDPRTLTYILTFTSPDGEIITNGPIGFRETVTIDAVPGEWILHVEAFDGTTEVANNGSQSLQVNPGRNEFTVNMFFIEAAALADYLQVVYDVYPNRSGQPVDLRLDLQLNPASWTALLNALDLAPVSVNLDLSTCILNDGIFAPPPTISAGKDRIISMILPNGTREIADGDGSLPGFINLSSVIIPDSVTRIGNYAFNNANLTSVSIPNGVTYIGDGAFADNNLGSLTLPSNITHIGDEAFANNNLNSITIPNGVTYLSGFNGNNLTSINIPSSVTTIGAYSFYGFYGNNLSNVTIPNSVTSIGAFAFGRNNLTGITIPNSVTTIGAYAFASSNLTSITIPTSVTSIGAGAFSNNNLIGHLTIPNSVTRIEELTFTDNNLSSVTISNSVNFIGVFAFVGQPLTSITIGANVIFESEWANAGDGTFNVSFEPQYISGGRLAGHYTRPGDGQPGSGVWTRQP